MKKSELIHKLNDLLETYEGSIISDGSLANDLLNLISGIGILPPLNEQKYHYMCNDSRRDITHCDYYYSWEEEDEKN